jgi:hypothetical protein
MRECTADLLQSSLIRLDCGPFVLRMLDGKKVEIRASAGD